MQKWNWVDWLLHVCLTCHVRRRFCWRDTASTAGSAGRRPGRSCWLRPGPGHQSIPVCDTLWGGIKMAHCDEQVAVKMQWKSDRRQYRTGKYLFCLPGPLLRRQRNLLYPWTYRRGYGWREANTFKGKTQSKIVKVMSTHRVATWCKGDGLHVMVGYDLSREEIISHYWWKK